MKFNLLASSYAIEVSVKNLLKIMHKDDDAPIEKRLFTILGRINGVFNVDYEGYFGNFIYLKIEKEFDNESTHESIAKAIKDYIKN